MIAVLVDPAAEASDLTVDLDAAEMHHLRVRRARTGDEVKVLDYHLGAASPLTDDD